MGLGFGFAVAPVGDRRPVGGAAGSPGRSPRARRCSPAPSAARSASPCSARWSTREVTDARRPRAAPTSSTSSPAVLEPAIHTMFVGSAIVAVALVAVSLLMPRKVETARAESSGALPCLPACRRADDRA